MKTTPRAASYKREGRRCAWERLTARRVEGRMRGEEGGDDEQPQFLRSTPFVAK